MSERNRKALARVMALLLLATGAVGLSACEEDLPHWAFRVYHGHVNDSVTGQPVAGAEVAVYLDSGDPTPWGEVCSTDVSGYYELPVGGDIRELRCTKDGYGTLRLINQIPGIDGEPGAIYNIQVDLLLVPIGEPENGN